MVWAWLSTDAYWGRWRTRADVEAQLASAWRVVGAYDATPASRSASPAPCRTASAFAYLADVFVLPEHRGHGLGKRLMQRMIDEGPGRDFRWVLFTADAHGLYEQFGFAEPDATAMVPRRAARAESSPAQHVLLPKARLRDETRRHRRRTATRRVA